MLGLNALAIPDDAIIGFCERAVAAGLPLARAHVLIDTLDPVHEGHVFRWGHDATLPPEQGYGRTSQIIASGELEPAFVPAAPQADAWRRSPFYRVRETGESLWRHRISAADETEFDVLAAYVAGGCTDYVAIINRFAADGIIGEMDCVYSAWATKDPSGFQSEHVAALQRMTPFLAHAIKSVSLARMTGTNPETCDSRTRAGALSGAARRLEEDKFQVITEHVPEDLNFPPGNHYSKDVISSKLRLILDGRLNSRRRFTSASPTRASMGETRAIDFSQCSYERAAMLAADFAVLISMSIIKPWFFHDFFL